MRRAVLIVATLASTVGLLAAPVQPKSSSLGERIELRIGETAGIDTEELQVGFEDVLTDSRCPKGEQCITAGDATVRLWLRASSGARDTRDLHTSPVDVDAEGSLAYDVQLLGLAPYPVANRSIAKNEYIATFVVTRRATPSRAAR